MLRLESTTSAKRDEAEVTLDRFACLMMSLQYVVHSAKPANIKRWCMEDPWHHCFELDKHGYVFAADALLH